jgi:acetyl-CoA carboxylase biotin carboxylase subunit
MGETAVQIGRLVGYSNAGTVEFLVDQHRKFHFLEMNTRLQVEHPVTETVVAIDLVREQFRIAAGERLAWHQEDIRMRGAAIECRIYAEDPTQNFVPSPGLITDLKTPEGPGVRLDSGVYQGWRVPLEYDSLLSKLVVWGNNRGEAIARMQRALSEYQVSGIQTTIFFFQRVLNHPDFIAGRTNTAFVDRVLAEGLLSLTEPAEEIVRVAALAAALEASRPERIPSPFAGRASAWKTSGRDLLLNRWPRRVTRGE